MSAALPQPPAQPFLSYSRQSDLAAANELRELLRAAGTEVFKDDASLHVGDRWFSRIEDALLHCSAFIVLVGQQGLTRWVGAETQVALSRNIGAPLNTPRLPIVPVLLGELPATVLPPFLSLFQAARWAPGQPLPSSLLSTVKASALTVQADPELLGLCPYRGLAAFRLQDQRLFFGRSRETLDAIQKLGDTQQTHPDRVRSARGGGHFKRWLQIEGNSGSGKSSLLMAGLLPMVRSGALWPRTGYAQWRILGPMMPGKEPLSKLAEVVELGLIGDGERPDIARLVRECMAADDQALALHLRNFKGRYPDTGFLLVVDQFEELFTFADARERQRFDAQLAHALQDAECPLFLVSTVRLDFLDRMELLPRLCEVYHSHREGYPLLTISPQGLREVIEMPALLAGLDVSEVTAAIVADARDEPGALPLVENALTTLWQQALPDAQGRRRLSGHEFETRGKLAGMLSAGADRLLAEIERAQPGKGERNALELLFSLTRINPHGRHTRQRIGRADAVMAAGHGDRAAGEQVLRMLSGERSAGQSSDQVSEVLRLVNVVKERNPRGLEVDDVDEVDLIHETLIRSRLQGPGQPAQPYWPRLYGFIEANRERDVIRQQLDRDLLRHQLAAPWLRWLKWSGWGALLDYRQLRVGPHSAQGRYLRAAQAVAVLQIGVLIMVSGTLAHGVWWVQKNNFPITYVLAPLWWTVSPVPDPETKDLDKGIFTIGCKPGRDVDAGGDCVKQGLPLAREMPMDKPCAMGRFAVTFAEYDRYVWASDGKVDYPSDAGWGRHTRPVINVSWHDTQAYVAWLSRATGQRHRLPSEAEWEYAARGGKEARYPWGDEAPGRQANCADCEGAPGRTTPVGSYPPNDWGLHDMAGNVWQWVEDKAQLEEAAKDAWRGLRGGSWNYNARYLRAAYLGGIAPGSRFNAIGFRVCRVSPIEKLNTGALSAEPLKR